MSWIHIEQIVSSVTCSGCSGLMKRKEVDGALFQSFFFRRLSTMFSASLFFTFPVTAINRLGKSTEFGECDVFFDT
jgi:hypothetical protein